MLGIGLDALFCNQESNDKENDTHGRQETHRKLVTERVISMTEKLDHWNGEAGYDETRGIGGDLAVRRDTGPLVGVSGHHRGQRRVWHIVDGIDHPEQDVGGPGVDDLACRTNIRGRKSEDTDDAKRQCRPQQPGPELTPSRVGAVRNHAHDGIEASDCQADDKEKCSCLRRRETKGVGVEVQLQGEHGLKDKISGHVAQRIANLFADRKFLNHPFPIVPTHQRVSLNARLIQTATSWRATPLSGDRRRTRTADHDREFTRFDHVLDVRQNVSPKLNSFEGRTVSHHPDMIRDITHPSRARLGAISHAV